MVEKNNNKKHHNASVESLQFSQLLQHFPLHPIKKMVCMSACKSFIVTGSLYIQGLTSEDLSTILIQQVRNSKALDLCMPSRHHIHYLLYRAMVLVVVVLVVVVPTEVVVVHW